MTVTKLNALLFLFFILLVSVEYYCVLGNGEASNDKVFELMMKTMRKYLVGININNQLFQSSKLLDDDDDDCKNKACDPTLDHCKDVPCGKCNPNPNRDGSFSCTDFLKPSENCEEEICIDETDEECFVLSCAGGCDTDSLHCRVTSPPPPQSESDLDTTIKSESPPQSESESESESELESESDSDTTIKLESDSDSDSDTVTATEQTEG